MGEDVLVLRYELEQLREKVDELEQLRARVAELESMVKPIPLYLSDSATVEMLYAEALRQGLITNAYNGLGSIVIPPGGVRELSDSINRWSWPTRLYLEGALGGEGTPNPDPYVQVTSITIAGLPINIGAKSAPLAMFSFKGDGGRSGGFTLDERRFLLVGQSFRVQLHNTHPTRDAIVSGGYECYEGSGFFDAKAHERLLLALGAKPSPDGDYYVRLYLRALLASANAAKGSGVSGDAGDAGSGASGSGSGA